MPLNSKKCYFNDCGIVRYFNVIGTKKYGMLLTFQSNSFAWNVM